MKPDLNRNLREQFSEYINDLQFEICTALENEDALKTFRADRWERDGGGGGNTKVIEKGRIFEKGGVNTSVVFGELPEPVKKHFKAEDGFFWAGGISLVIHPESPMIPTVHANFRYFELYKDEKMEHPVDCWFGGGADLTPYYLFEEDASHFHKVFKKTCDKHDSRLYPLFKKECDEYFYNTHREEARGIGGLFFDYLREGDFEQTSEEWYDFVTDCGKSFLESYLPIVQKRKFEEWHEKHRYWQEIRRGRYVEFNLVHDRGTLFGLKTNGRIESIFMSLPPRVRWDYDYKPEKNSEESKLIAVLKNPGDWL